MKALRLVLLAGICLTFVSTIRAQVKIGDNPLDIGNDRLLEIERAGELMIVTDSLEFGLTNNPTTNLPATDALTIKFFGYGLGNFTPALTGTTQDYFLGTNNAGEVLEFPLSLDLVTSSPATATLSLYNGTTTFGSVDLTNLDSVFATNIALNDTANVLRNLIADSESADGDTITGNEWIDEIVLEADQRARMWIYEDTGVPDAARHSAFVDLGYIFVTDVELIDSLDSVHVRVTREIRDTAQVLRDLIDNTNIYTASSFLRGDRTVSGAGNSLAFSGVDSFQVDGVNIDLNGDINTIITADADNNGTGDLILQNGAQDVLTIEQNENVLFSSAANDSTLFLNSDGSIILSDYGTFANTGTHSTILGVTSDGNIVDVNVADILASEADSTIYSHDGTLSADRTLTGGGNNLTFSGLNNYTISASIVSTTTSGDNTEIVGGNKGITTIGNNDFTSTGTTTIDGSSVTVQASDQNIISVESDQDVLFSSGTVDSTLYIDANGTVSAEIYGTGTTTGTFANIIGVTSSGQLIDVNVADILATQADSTIYSHDGTLSANRTLTGAGNNLTFTGLGAFNIDGSNLTVDNTADIDLNGQGNITLHADSENNGTGDIIIQNGTTNVVTVEANDNVTFSSASTDSTLFLNNDGSVILSDYGTFANTGTHNTILGVTSNGNIVDVNVADILASEEDSTIYTHDGTLTAMRYMSMDGKNLHFVGSANDTIVITDDGRMGVNTGTFTPNSPTSNVKLEVNGDVFAVQFHSSSDKRYKKNIQPIESALDKVMQIEGVKYDFKNEAYPAKHFPITKQVGFIAQNVEEVLPEVVMTDGNGFKAVDYAKVTALLNEAIKEQQKQILELTQILTTTRSENQILKEEISSIKAMLIGSNETKITDEE